MLIFDYPIPLSAGVPGPELAIVSRRRAHGDDGDEVDSFPLSWDVGGVVLLRSGTGHIGTSSTLVFADNVRVQAPELTSSQDPFADALRRIDEFRGLEPNWNSYGAERVTREAISAAKVLFRALSDDARQLGPGLRPVAVVPLGSGGVQVEWFGPGGELEVEIEPDGTLGYLLITGTAPDRHFEEAAIASRTHILNLVRRVLHG